MASKRKGLSLEEKIIKVEAFLKSHPEPYTLKELEALIPKATGVIPQSVPECLELLASEQRCRTGKIGVSTYFWRFDSTQNFAVVANVGAAAAKLQQLQQALSHISSEIQENQQQNGSITDRNDLLLQLQALQMENRSLEERLQSGNLSTLVAQQRDSNRQLLENVNAITENVFIAEDYALHRRGLSRGSFRTGFQISEDFDFIPP
jgi:hypothetical protein